MSNIKEKMIEMQEEWWDSLTPKQQEKYLEKEERKKEKLIRKLQKKKDFLLKEIQDIETSINHIMDIYA